MNSTTCDIDQYIQHNSSLIYQHLESLVQEQEVDYNTLFKAARYSLLSDGKKIRPILAIATAESLGCDPKLALQPSCALEMIHTYSLIHDDLPCMDNDDFRRGKPSLHRAFSEAQAILAGDFLLTYAFEILVNAPHLTAQQKEELVRVLAKNSGSSGMIGGQVMDIEAEGKKLDISSLRQIHERKTGALIKASIEFGAIIARASKEHRDLLKQVGHSMGLAFQIADDVIDITSCKNSDSKNNKSTYVSLLGLDEAKNLSQLYYQKAIEQLDLLPFDMGILKAIAYKLVKRSK